MKSLAVFSAKGGVGNADQIMTYKDMVTDGGASPWYVLLGILVVQFVLPAAIALLVSEIMRKKNWIKPGEMALIKTGV